MGLGLGGELLLVSDAKRFLGVQMGQWDNGTVGWGLCVRMWLSQKYVKFDSGRENVGGRRSVRVALKFQVSV